MLAVAARMGSRLGRVGEPLLGPFPFSGCRSTVVGAEEGRSCAKCSCFAAEH